MTPQEAYEKCLEIAKQENWIACYNAMAEEGFDKSVDWIWLLSGFERERHPLATPSITTQ